MLGHLKKNNEAVMGYIVATYKPRSMVELEDVILQHYGQAKKLERMYRQQLQQIGRCPWPVVANNMNSIYNLLQTTLAVLTSAESCITYFRRKNGNTPSRKSAEPRTSNKHLYQHPTQSDGPKMGV